MTTGQRIKAARKSAGMTQAELANKLGIPFQSISQWERDIRNPKTDTLRKIGEAIGVDWRDLTTDEDQNNSTSKPGFAVSITPISAAISATLERAERAEKLSAAFQKLNDEGQQKAVERIEELAEIAKYTVRFESLTPEEKHLADIGQWSKLYEKQFGAADSKSAHKKGKS